jgi:uncharacterized protein YndB with AHSA1/START domain
MPIKKDGTGTRWVEMDFVAPGTPEQIWHAMATGPGNAAWFTKATIDGRVGGELTFDFGPDGTQTGEVTAWEPPRRFAYVEREWSEGAPPVATEITITARSGDECVVRMVHSLFASSDDWDDQMEGFEKGWPGFFQVLGLYLTHFAGLPSASFMAIAKSEGDHLVVWKHLAQELDLAGADVGERRATPPQPEALSGVVERIHQDRQMRYITIRLDDPAPGIALVGTYDAGAQVITSMNLYFYGDAADARAAASERRWRDWLGARFGAEYREPAQGVTPKG